MWYRSSELRELTKKKNGNAFQEISAFEWLEAVARARDTYAIFVRCVPNHMPSFESFATAVINELRFERERQAAGGVGVFGYPELSECVWDGRNVPVVKVEHNHVLGGVVVCATVRVVCSEGRIVDVGSMEHKPAQKRRSMT